jgi:hypothetical protein
VTWSLGLEDRQRLVAAFLNVDGMRRRGTRDLYLEVLEQELGHPLPVTRHEQDLYDVWHLVTTCLGHTGAIHTLLTVMEAFHGGSRSMDAARTVVEELVPEPLLSLSERRELRRLVEALESEGGHGAHPAGLTGLYREAVGPLGPLLAGRPHGLLDVLARLEDVPVGPDGVPPLLAFVGRLAERANGSTSRGLWKWIHGFAQRYGLDQGRLRELGRSEGRWGRFGGSGTYLVIECRPDAAGTGQVLVTAWLQIGDEPGITLQCDDEPQPLERLPVLLERLLTRDQLVVGRPTPELTIEFVLPRGLLDRPFDQLKITVDGLERRLGIEYPVVMRSLDRLRKQALHHNWRRKWERLRANPSRASACWIHRPREFGHESLFARLSEESPAVLALSFPPWAQRPDEVDELWVGLQAGTPIIVWCRRPRDFTRFAEEIGALLGPDPMELPGNVLRLRRRALLDHPAETGGDHLGLHLSLVFDDADRIPEPYIPLKPPA